MTVQIKGPKGNHWPRVITSGSSSVKIYEVEHSTNASGKAYVLAWRTPAGRKTQKFANPEAAILEGKIKASQLAAGRIEGAEMTRGDRDELQAARRLTEGIPLLSALEEWSKARQLTAGNVMDAAKAWAAKNGKVEKRTKVADVVKAFLKAKTAAGKNVAKDHAHTFSLIISDLGEFTIDTVSSKQLDTWLAKAENPVSRNTRRKRLVSIWRWAQPNGYLARDAHTEAEMTERAHEPAPEIGIIDVTTWRSLLAHFRDYHKELVPALILAGFCGMRRAEIHAQTWEDISLDRKNLRVTKAKRGTPARRMVPLCDAAIEWLMLCSDRKGPICDGLAIDGIRRIGQEGGAKLPDNCFRHSYISHAVAATGNIPRVSLDAGNSPKEINRHYRELVSEADGKAWFDSAPAKLGDTIPFKKASNG
jgi:integrase